MDEFSIRDFQESEENEFYSMARLLYESDAIGKEIGQEALEETFGKCIGKSPYVRGIFAVKSGKIAGYALVTFTYSNEYGGLMMFLDEFYVKEEFRRQGIGSAFICEIIEEYKNKAACMALVVVKDNLSAINLYKKLGFRFSEYESMYRPLMF